MRITRLLGTALLMAAGPAGAQTVQATAPAMAAVDPARLAEARLVAAKLLPPGIYRTVMNAAMAPMADSMTGMLKAMPLKQMAAMGGLDAKQAAALDKVNVEQVMAIYDPHWQERSRLTMTAMFAAMGEFFTTQEPALREAMAHAYANGFTLAELRDVDAFLASPSGTKFAGRYMTIMADPAVAAETRAMMPKLMAQMPTFMAAAQKATAGLPPPRKLKDLSPADRAALARALGVREGQLKDPKGT